jgi:hypothetical protein
VLLPFVRRKLLLPGDTLLLARDSLARVEMETETLD